jgi:hypothetical protein
MIMRGGMTCRKEHCLDCTSLPAFDSKDGIFSITCGV